DNSLQPASAAVYIDGNALRVGRHTAHQRLLDLCLEFRGCQARSDGHQLVTPLTPVSRRMTRSATCRSNCHSTSSLSVTWPLDAVTSTLSIRTKASHSSART